MLVGGPAELGGLDWTLAWARELRIDGTYVYGPEPSREGAPHTMDEAIRLMAAHPELPLAEMVTHTFPLGSAESHARCVGEPGRYRLGVK